MILKAYADDSFVFAPHYVFVSIRIDTENTIQSHPVGKSKIHIYTDLSSTEYVDLKSDTWLSNTGFTEASGVSWLSVLHAIIYRYSTNSHINAGVEVME